MMVEEQGVSYESKIVANTVRGCILTDRMATMMVANFAYDEIEVKFLNDNFNQAEIIRTYNILIDAGKDREKILPGG